MPTFGEKISAMRIERGLSVKALASLSNVSHTTLLRVEHGGSTHGDTIKSVIGGLHKAAPLSEIDVFELARGTKLSEGAIIAYLSRLAPVQQQVPKEAEPLESWRKKCHALVDRMLARAADPRDVELALVAMIAAFEAQIPGASTEPMLTRRGTSRAIAPGVTERVDEHYTPRQKNTG